MTPGRSIPTGRTWRDLPPAPPTSFVPAALPADPPPEPEFQRSRLWPFVLGGLTVVLVGFLVGLALPLDDGAPIDTSALPDVIVPPSPTLPPPDTAVPESPGVPVIPSSDRLFTVPEPPPGYRERADMANATPDRIEQKVVLTNGSDEVVVFASASADILELPEGELVEVRGVEGVVVERGDGNLVLTWIEPGRVLMSITASESFGLPQMLLLAESVEMT